MSNAQFVLLYLIVINVISFVVFAVDKYRARKQLSRVPELSLFILAILCGSVGAWSGMYFFHHKTKQLKFVLGIPLIFLLQVVIALYVLNCKS